MDDAVRRLEGEMGVPDYLSRPVPFPDTDYYAAQMGSGLKRRVLAFERLRSPGELATVKTLTNAVESEFLSGGGRRRVNIDPGYLTLHNVVVASCKNFAHRVYIGKGVYAEVAFIFSAGKKAYRHLEWTYPDFRTDEMKGLFMDMRRLYSAGLKEKLDVWGPPEPDYPLMLRLKQAFDPKGVLNPGRMYEGI